MRRPGHEHLIHRARHDRDLDGLAVAAQVQRHFLARLDVLHRGDEVATGGHRLGVDRDDDIAGLDAGFRRRAAGADAIDPHAAAIGFSAAEIDAEHGAARRRQQEFEFPHRLRSAGLRREFRDLAGRSLESLLGILKALFERGFITCLGVRWQCDDT